jgi:hypothetical protein
MIRIVWRFDPKVSSEDLLADVPEVVKQLNLPAYARHCSPIFLNSRAQLREDLRLLPSSSQMSPVDDITHYYNLFLKDEKSLQVVVNAMREAQKAGLISSFDVQGNIGTYLPPPAPTTDGFLDGEYDYGPTGASHSWERFQLYLGPGDAKRVKPSGVDALYAWALKGGRGNEVRLVDIEEGWNLHHEDLEGQVTARFGDVNDHYHGTAVLGILCARSKDPRGKAVGVVGMAHDAQVGVAPIQIQADQEPNTEGLIKNVCSWLGAGDVLLLEIQATRPGMEGTEGDSAYLPIEAWEHGRTAIQLAHQKGIYVIQAAANGGLNLDVVDGMLPSGPSLMVGAGHPITGRTLKGSNTGRRVDVQGWGQDVVTTGSVDGDYHRDLQYREDTNACYMKSFSGTSSAAAIVAGCVAVISSIVKAHGLPPISPEKMKSLLQETGSFRNPAENGGIGPLPNLRAALTQLEADLCAEYGDFKGFEQAPETELPKLAKVMELVEA